MKMLLFRSPVLSVYIGFVIWGLSFINLLPYSFFALSHVQSLLIAAPLWIIPLALFLDRKPSILLWISLVSSLLFTISYQLEKGGIAAGLTIPWLGLVIYLAFRAFQQGSLSMNIIDMTKLAAYFYLPVGAIWAFVDRLGIPVLGYDPTIILLTAVHFHYAGFMLPLTAFWLAKVYPRNYLKYLNLGIIIGIPLVAIGISATHFQWPSWIEVAGVTIMACSGALLGLFYAGFGLMQKRTLPGILFIIGGLALFLGMALALCYGWRHVFLIEVLTIPWMYAIHGTCNALGFAVPIVIAWFIRMKKLPFIFVDAKASEKV